MKNWLSIIFSLFYICLHLDEVCIFCDFGTLGFGVGPPGLPKTMNKTISRPMGVLTSRGTKMPTNEDLIILETYVQQGFHI